MSNGKPFIDFKALKERVPFLAVLERYHVQLKKVNNSQFKANCPLPSHTSKDKDTFCVNAEKQVWYCHSDSCKKNGQRAGGNVLDFVSLMDNCSPYLAAVKLNEWYPTSTEPTNGTAPKAEPPNPPSKELNHELAFELKGITYCDYLAQRGITEETAKHFGVGLFPGKGSMAGRVVIPIRNESGGLVAYAGRSVNEEEPKYKLPAGFHKGQVVYNLNDIDDDRVERVVLVEGFFSVLWLHQAGYQNVVALMGRTITPEQVELLRRFQDIVIMLDGDEPGREATLEVAKALWHEHYINVVELPDGEQPHDIPAEELAHYLGASS